MDGGDHDKGPRIAQLSRAANWLHILFVLSPNFSNICLSEYYFNANVIFLTVGTNVPIPT